MNLHICVHGHFYQPPRENAWSGRLEEQPSAKPYHDWNERICAESYAPNCATPIYEGSKLVKTVNNYEQMSFNMGATLLSWMEEHQPETYARIIAADKVARENFNGHGTAIAQVYNHIIMPLASRLDKETQVIWGLRDFEYRFGRKPEGMWLAETAVDTATLEVLAEQGIKFTILAPWQAEAVKECGVKGARWRKLKENIDFHQPYQVNLPSGRSIAVFFYCGNISGAIAFGGMLNDGVNFANGLIDQANQGKGPQLVNIATDGETYGHHHKKGEMALAYCLDYIRKNKLATITVYGEYLEKFPPQTEVRIKEPSAWSCSHGVGRWSDNCGCTMNDKFHHKWRKPLRDSLNWLRDELLAYFAVKGLNYLKNPWAARNAYIDVVLEKGNSEIWQKFLAEQSCRKLNAKEAKIVRDMLETQRMALLMFTSCGWFFDDISGLESVQCLQYACRAIEYHKAATGFDLEPEFIRKLELAPSNYKKYKNGAKVWKELVVTGRNVLNR